MYFKIANQKDEKPDAFLIVKRRSVTKKSSSRYHSNRTKSKNHHLHNILNEKNLSPSPIESKHQQLTPAKRSHCKQCSQTPNQKTRTNSIRQANYQSQQKNQLAVSRCPEPNYICNYDKQMELENKKLRQQNKCLNEYYSMFSKKYDEKCQQLRKIKQSRYLSPKQEFRPQQFKYGLNNMYHSSKATQQSDSGNTYSPLTSRRDSPSFSVTPI